jgi:hypothetical protein
MVTARVTSSLFRCDVFRRSFLLLFGLLEASDDVQFLAFIDD